MTLTPLCSLESAKKKFLMKSTYIMSRNWESNVFGNQTFLGSGDRNDSNTALFARIREKKIFDELDVHHVLKVGIKRFWAQETEMTLTPLFSLESARKKIFDEHDVHHV